MTGVTAAPDSLDAAWQEAEAALPDGWHLALHSKVVGLSAACAYRGDHDKPKDNMVVDTPDGPAAALRNLAQALRDAAREPLA